LTGVVLVTGASGFVGRAVVAGLLSEGRSVRAAQRSGAAIAGATAVSMGSLEEAQDWSALVSGVDCIIHCAARAHVLNEAEADPLAQFRKVNTKATLALAAAAAKGGVRRFIFLSSIGVNAGETFGTPFRHDDPPRPHSDYAIAKAEAETGLGAIAEKTGLEVVIIRPPLILGPNPKGNLGMLAKAISRGIPLPLGSVTSNKRDLVSLDTLYSLISACIDHPAAPGQVFLVADGVTRSTRAIVEEVAVHAAKAARIVPIPARLLAIALKTIGRTSLASQLLGDLEVDISHTRRTLGWVPPARP
jgi:nucleoside-diphosphate-sugar epimerase